MARAMSRSHSRFRGSDLRRRCVPSAPVTPREGGGPWQLARIPAFAGMTNALGGFHAK
jgi:hypothetical protein